MTSSIGTGSRTATSGTDKGERDPTKLEKRRQPHFLIQSFFPKLKKMFLRDLKYRVLGTFGGKLKAIASMRGCLGIVSLGNGFKLSKILNDPEYQVFKVDHLVSLREKIRTLPQYSNTPY